MNTQPQDDFFGDSTYEIPVTSNYMRFVDGDNTFRVLSSAITGYEYFNTDNKPVRSKEPFDDMPYDIKEKGEIKHFWAFCVWNFRAKRIQILEITQKGIMKKMQAYIKNPQWGNPRGYDLTVTRSGSGLLTEYEVIANPHKLLDAGIINQYDAMNINLNALYDGSDPFSKEK